MRGTRIWPRSASTCTSANTAPKACIENCSRSGPGFDSLRASIACPPWRASTAAIAAAAGITEGRASRRLATLIQRRVVVLDLDLATEAFGYRVGARLFLRVAPAHLEQVGRTLADLPQVGFIAAMSGSSNMIVTGTFRDLSDLYAFTTTQVGALDGIQTLEVIPFTRIVKQSGGIVVDGRLVDRA